MSWPLSCDSQRALVRVPAPIQGSRLALVACPECGRKVSELAETCPNCGHIFKTDPRLEIASHLKALKVTIGLAVLVVLGSFLPWARVTSDELGAVTFGGMNGDGVVTLILAGFVIAIGLLTHSRGRAGPGQIWLLFLCAVGIAVIGIYDFVNINSIAGQTESGLTTASVGVGLYMVAAAGIGLVAAEVWVLRTRPEPPVEEDDS